MPQVGKGSLLDDQYAPRHAKAVFDHLCPSGYDAIKPIGGTPLLHPSYWAGAADFTPPGSAQLADGLLGGFALRCSSSLYGSSSDGLDDRRWLVVGTPYLLAKDATPYYLIEVCQSICIWRVVWGSLRPSCMGVRMPAPVSMCRHVSHIHLSFGVPVVVLEYAGGGVSLRPPHQRPHRLLPAAAGQRHKCASGLRVLRNRVVQTPA